MSVHGVLGTMLEDTILSKKQGKPAVLTHTCVLLQSNIQLKDNQLGVQRLGSHLTAVVCGRGTAPPHELAEHQSVHTIYDPTGCSNVEPLPF